MMQHIQTHLQTVFLPHKPNQDARAHSLTGDGAFLRNQLNGFLRMFSKSVGHLRPWRNWSHPRHATFPLSPFPPLIFVKSSSSLTAFNAHMSVRLQLSSCITLSISPLCLLFSTFFFPPVAGQSRFASLKAKEGSKVTGLYNQSLNGRWDILVSNPPGWETRLCPVRSFCPSQTQQDMTRHGDKKLFKSRKLIKASNLGLETGCVFFPLLLTVLQKVSFCFVSCDVPQS